MDQPECKQMQVKVLYSFNNNNTVFLSRSEGVYSVRVASIPSGTEEIMLGGFDLKSCIYQILNSSPENFHLATEDYAVYYKDLTEQPDEPFVSNGVLSDLLQGSNENLIPGRVCQNVSANFLFGNNNKANSLTLEIRLKLHSIERSHMDPSNPPPSLNQVLDHSHSHNQSRGHSRSNSYGTPMNNNQNLNQKRPNVYEDVSANKIQKTLQPSKATRTKSLPVFHQPLHQIYNIRSADRNNMPSRYDPQSIQDRFKSASFVENQVIPKPKVLRRKARAGAMRTRSMIDTKMISSPIHEEGSSDSDDSEYNEKTARKAYVQQQDEEEDEEEEEEDEQDLVVGTSPCTPHQHKDTLFEALPDLEDLDSRKIHTISSRKLPSDHGLICANPNCVTDSSITWRYFEVGLRPNFFEIHRATEFNKKHYEGMYGPLCNACYLFLRNKGFLRPENIVRKYLKQQSYKKDKNNTKNFQAPPLPRKLNQIASSPMLQHKFATPSHTPSEINQAIQTSRMGNQDLNDFINQLNSFGGPLTDIDLPEGITPPMMATKSNTRVINIDDDNKENYPPPDITQFNSSSSPARNGTEDFEKMIIKSFSKSSPLEGDWMSMFNSNNNNNSRSSGPTPNDQQVVTPLDDSKRTHPALPQFKSFNTTRRSPRLNKIKNISSSPPAQTELDLLQKEINNIRNSSPHPIATRNDTSNSVLSLYKNEVSSPSEIYDTKNKV